MIYIGVIAGVVVVLLTVTIIKALTVKNEADFLVAGRKLPWWVLVSTLLCSWIGAGSLFAGAENATHIGFAALWQPAGGWVGLILIFTIAGRARRFAQYTVPDLLENRYNTAARVLGTVAIVIAYTMITSYQMKAGGDILHLIFPELDRARGMYMVAAFVIAFTAGAGMASVAYLDLVIGALVTAIVLYAFPVLLHGAGGWTAVRQALPASHFQILGPISFERALGLMIPTTLLLIGNQGMYQKFFSARSERDAKIAAGGWIASTLVLETVIIAIAVVGSARFHPEQAREMIPYTARHGLPTLAGALLLGGIFAKLISTANNYLFSPATNLIHDVYQRFIDPHASERRNLIVSRLVVVALGVYAVLQATRFESILSASLYAYTVYGAAVTPAVMAVFFWKRATTAGAVASIGLGTLVTVVWNLAGNPWGWDAIHPALAVSVASLVLVSLAGAPPPKKKWAPFFEPAMKGSV
ncbi:MAG: sodium:solute symporter family protein [Bryobacteraceae bacterium]|jgi:Na+/proline symporter